MVSAFRFFFIIIFFFIMQDNSVHSITCMYLCIHISSLKVKCCFKINILIIHHKYGDETTNTGKWKESPKEQWPNFLVYAIIY